MKKILSSIILLSIFIANPLFSQKCYETSGDQKLNKTNGSPSRVKFNINNISTWIYNSGGQDIQPNGNSGFEYPKGEDKYSIYESGLVWGGKIDEQIYVGGSTYSQGLLPGRVLPNGEREVGVDGDRVRIFRVRPDFQTGDMSSEVNDGEGTEEEIRTQYELEWNEWPAEFGAPFNDMDNNGVYNSLVDVPGVPDAHQTIWYVANDLDASTTRSLYGSDPMGAELQVTMWGYNIPGHLENVMFKKYKLINKSENKFEEMYFGQWSDMDIGDARDDHLGIDTLLNIQYGYNGDEYDSEYRLTPPAIGFQLLQGPIVNSPGSTAYADGKEVTDYENLKLTANYFYICGSPLWNDPDLGEYLTGTLQMYAHMQGVHTGYSPIQIPEQLGGGTTKFPLSGNPLTGEGWNHGILFHPCDIRGVTSSGPFIIEAGESQEIVIAQIGAIGTNNLNSVAVLKNYANKLQNEYPNFNLEISAPTLVNILPSIKENEFCAFDVIELNIEQENSFENLSESGYNFQGFRIFQSDEATNLITSSYNIFTYDINDDVANIYGDAIDPNTGYIINGVTFNGTNSGIPKIVKIENDVIHSSPLLKGREYFFGITAYFYNKEENKSIESSLDTVSITFQDDIGGAAFMDSVYATITSGNSDVLINIEVVDPTKLTGDTYKVTFGDQHYYLDNNGAWVKTNYPDSIGKSFKNPNDLSNSTLIPLPSKFAPNNTLDLRLEVDIQSENNSKADSVKLIFPNGVIINDAKIYTNWGFEMSSIKSVITGNYVMWSDPTFISDGDILFINIDYAEPTFTVQFEIFDNGYDGNPINAVGSINLTGEVGYQFKTERYWNLFNKTKNVFSLENETILAGREINEPRRVPYNYEPIVDGFRIKLDGTFDPPTTILAEDFTVDADPSDGDLDLWGDATLFGGATGFWFEFGPTVTVPTVEASQPDLQFRFTGVADNNDAVVTAGGQFTTLWERDAFGASDMTGLNSVQFRVPFEVWDIESNRQLEVAVINRNADGASPYDNDVGAPGEARWRITGRDYIVILNKEYTDDPDLRRDLNDESATWLLFFRQAGASVWSTGDVYTVAFANPIQFTDTYTFTTPEAPTDKISPNKFNVFQNYPNPFNPNTIIRYFIPEDGNAKITIYNILGQKVSEILNNNVKAGKYETEFNGSNMANGVYIYRIEVESPTNTNIYSQTKKMLLLK